MEANGPRVFLVTEMSFLLLAQFWADLNLGPSLDTSGCGREQPSGYSGEEYPVVPKAQLCQKTSCHHWGGSSL